jgi:G3E family GTPase
MHRRLPVTLIGGSLGAGKTSLVHHLVTEHPGGHLALLVEAAAAGNPDARALRGLCGAMGRTYHAVEEIASQDGKVIAAKLRELAQTGRYERALVEVSGTTDPAYWVRALEASSGVEVEQVVGVVDLLEFHHAFIASGAASSAHPLREFQRGLVEGADLLVLNKCDLAGDSERRHVTRLLRQMNPVAPIVETDYGEVPLEMVFRPTPLRAKKETDPAPLQAPLLQSVVFRAHRPFHPQRFWDWFNAPHAGLWRVKGLVWLATRNLLVGGVSRTSGQNSCGAAGVWWAALPREEWPTDPLILEQMQADWREPYGDRRQELVLTGEKGPTEEAARHLNACLLTEEEYAKPVAEWCRWSDPFPAWDLAEG